MVSINRSNFPFSALPRQRLNTVFVGDSRDFVSFAPLPFHFLGLTLRSALPAPPGPSDGQAWLAAAALLHHPPPPSLLFFSSSCAPLYFSYIALCHDSLLPAAAMATGPQLAQAAPCLPSPSPPCVVYLDEGGRHWCCRGYGSLGAAAVNREFHSGSRDPASEQKEKKNPF